MIYQYHTLGSCVEEIRTREIAHKLAFLIYYWHRAATRQLALNFAHLIPWMAEIKFAIHNILRTDTQVDQAHSGKSMMGCTTNQYSLFFCHRQCASRDEQIPSYYQGGCSTFNRLELCILTVTQN